MSAERFYGAYSAVIDRGDRRNCKFACMLLGLRSIGPAIGKTSPRQNGQDVRPTEQARGLYYGTELPMRKSRNS